MRSEAEIREVLALLADVLSGAGLEPHSLQSLRAAIAAFAFVLREDQPFVDWERSLRECRELTQDLDSEAELAGA